MRILAFDTATAATAVALRDIGMPVPDGAAPAAGQVDLEARDDPAAGTRPGHTRRLLPLIEEVLAGGGGWDAVDRLAVGIGPGTFTGLRIGIATAHALARARGIGLVGVSSLRSLAAAAYRAPLDVPVLALIDARRGEVYGAAWAHGADPAAAQSLLAPSVLTPEELVRVCGRLGHGVVAVGDGAVHFRATLERAGAVIAPDDSPLHRVTARQHCRVAVAIDPGAPDTVLPAYLRLPDAELARPA